MPRLFVAADLPEETREKLAEISFGIPGADWVPSEQYHLTLRFLGERDESTFETIREGLGSLVSPSFYLTLRGIGHFPLRGEPETLWAGTAKNEELVRLRNKVESVMAAKGLERDTRKFHPHVTLARVREARGEWVAGYIVQHALFSLQEIPVQSFSLFSSRLTPEGAIHTREASYPLEGLLQAR